MTAEYEPGHCPDSEDGICMADTPCAYGCDDEGKPTYDEAIKALRRSLLRTHWVLCHPALGGQTVLAAVHGFQYNGPVWPQQPEIRAALRMAGLPEELPHPTYPANEAGVFKKKFQEVSVGTQTIIEHKWEATPDPEEALFLGTWMECHDWMKENSFETGYYVNNTGRVLDRGEEEAFFAQFES